MTRRVVCKKDAKAPHITNVMQEVLIWPSYGKKRLGYFVTIQCMRSSMNFRRYHISILLHRTLSLAPSLSVKSLPSATHAWPRNSLLLHKSHKQNRTWLGLLTENVSADAMSPTHKATLQSLLCRLLRRMLTLWHVPMPDIAHDQWFRTKVLPIVADEDGHVVAATSAVSCVQGLFGAGKSRAAAILLLGLMALDTEGECHFQVVCKENTGTRSFVEMVEYLEFPTELYQRIGSPKNIQCLF